MLRGRRWVEATLREGKAYGYAQPAGSVDPKPNPRAERSRSPAVYLTATNAGNITRIFFKGSRHGFIVTEAVGEGLLNVL